MVEDFYKILGVRWNATDEQIGQAYRSLVRRYHPDVNQEPGAFEKFQEIQKAFEVLSDPARRAAFNQNRSKTVPSPVKGVYNPAKFHHTNYQRGSDDRIKLLFMNLGCLVLMMVMLLVVVLINYEVGGGEKSITPGRVLLSAFKTSAFWVIVPFLLIMMCLNICYFATHRVPRQRRKWKIDWKTIWNWIFNLRDVFTFYTILFIMFFSLIVSFYIYMAIYHRAVY